MNNIISKRGFETVDPEFVVDLDNDASIFFPQRGTKGSAGYDFKAPFTFVIRPFMTFVFSTNIKAYMKPDEVLEIHIRSSLALKKNLMIKNIVGIVDSDYYNNPKNDGNIMIALKNEGTDTVIIEKGQRLVQGIFQKYLIIDDDNPISSKRIGDCGSTGV